MPFTRGAREVPNQTPASSSDARKRIEEAVNAIRDGLRDAVENMDTSKIEAFLAAGYEANHTPPPAPREPWADISTDREQPTTAWVTFENAEDEPVLGRWFRDETGRISCRGRGGWGEVQYVTAVNPVTVLDPETHVPVERALIDEAAAWIAWWNEDDSSTARPDGVRTSDSTLAALADGAES